MNPRAPLWRGVATSAKVLQQEPLPTKTGKPGPPAKQTNDPGQLARSGAMSLFTSFGIQGLNIVSGIITARLLGPAGKGELTAVLLWPGVLAAVGGLGLIEAVVYFTARVGREREIAGTGLLVALLQSLVLVMIGYYIVPLVLGHYGSQAVHAARLYLVWLPLSLLTLTAMGILQGKMEFGSFNRLRLTVIAISVFGLVGLYLAGWVSVTNIVLVYIGANVLTLAAAVSALAIRGWLAFRPAADLIRPMMIYGLKSHTETVAGMANLRADQMIIALFLAPVSLGLYVVAVTLGSALGLLSSSVALVALPAVARGHSIGEMRRDFIRSVRVTFVLSAITAVLIVFLTPFLISLFFGRAFLPATNVARVLLLAAVILSTSRVLSACLKAINRPLVPGLAELLAVIITVVALAALLPWLGLMGAAIASLLAYGASFSYMAWFSMRHLEISPLALILPTRSDITWGISQVRSLHLVK